MSHRVNSKKRKEKVIYIVASIDSSVFFKSLSNISLCGISQSWCIYLPLKNILIASSFGNYDQWFINILYIFHGHKFFISWGAAQNQDAVLRVLLKICLVFSEGQTIFQSGCTTLYSYLMNKNSWWMRITDASYAASNQCCLCFGF